MISVRVPEELVEALKNIAYLKDEQPSAIHFDLLMRAFFGLVRCEVVKGYGEAPATRSRDVEKGLAALSAVSRVSVEELRKEILENALYGIKGAIKDIKE